MSVKNRLTGKRAIELLREIVAEHGAETVYEMPEDEGRCVYVNNEAPSCIVGRALIRHGFAVETLKGLDKPMGTAAFMLPDHLKLVTQQAADIFDKAQDAQDSGRPWGTALADAEAEARHLGVKA